MNLLDDEVSDTSETKIKIIDNKVDIYELVWGWLAAGYYTSSSLYGGNIMAVPFKRTGKPEKENAALIINYKNLH